MNYFLPIIELIILLYFVVLNGMYLFLNVLSFASVSRYMQSHDIAGLPELLSEFASPVSVLVPAYNEENNILNTVKSLLDLDYPNFEIVVVNDGSSDKTLELLKQEYSLIPFPEAYRVRIDTKPVHEVYQSTSHPQLRVIDKENGDRADAVNAGVNAARYPLFCCVDADSIVQKNSLRLIAQPFLEDPTVVACGGTIRIGNGCQIHQGQLTKVELSNNPLVLFQIVEYLRAFLFGRMGWSPLNAHLLVSGAFGMFRKETVVSVGGYHPDALGEDMELVIRLHRKLSQQGKPYRITFVPDPICWTLVPSTLSHLSRQRKRWHIGHIQALWMNIGLLFSRKGGAAGWFAFPFSFFFEWVGPIIEAMGYVIIVSGFLFGFIATEIFLAFLIVAIGFGVLLSVAALFLEEISFHLYPRPRHILILFVVAILENLGYRQLNTVWRVGANINYLIGRMKASKK